MYICTHPPSHILSEDLFDFSEMGVDFGDDTPDSNPISVPVPVPVPEVENCICI